MSADLHIHSTASDGSDTPEEVVELAIAKGFNTIAVADHDTVDGIERAVKAAENKKLEIIPAIEFSTFQDKAEIHILGYFIDYTDKILINKINEIFQARLNRAKMMIDLLKEQGVKITFNQVKKMAGDEYIGRPHIAKTMIEKGYIEKMGEAFTEKYIGNGGKAYVAKYQLTPVDAIKLIKKTGGIPVLAHPVFINHGEALVKEDIKTLKKSGLEGIEVFHSKHKKKDSRYYKKVARELNLIITGGSDYHGDNSPDIELGDIILEDKYVEKLKNSRN